MWHRYVQWWERAEARQRWAILSVSLATIFGATYRLLYLRSTLQFLADQGRDVIIAYGILHGDIALVGPSTSVGNMYLAPFYYYFMAPWLLLAGYDPIGPAVAVAIIGILTIPLLYWVGKRLVGTLAATIATLLYASAPVAAEYTRFSWNPNPAPAVMLLLIYGVWRAWRGSPRWWLWVAVWWSILIQLHYVALIALAPAGVVWLASLWQAHQQKQFLRRRQLGLAALGGVAIFILSHLPLVVFDIRFNGTIRAGFAEFFTGDANEQAMSMGMKLQRSVRETQGRAMNVLLEIWGNKDWTRWYRQINTWLLTAYVTLMAVMCWRWRKTPYQFGWNVLVLTFLFTVAGLAWYRGVVYHHYITFFLPISYLITGTILAFLAKELKFGGAIAGGVLLSYIAWMSVQPSSLLYLKQLGWTIDDYQATAELILQNIPADESYTIANLSEVRDYRGMSYRYFLLASDHPPVDFAEAASADNLVIIAESPREPDTVLPSPVYEVASFPKGEYTYQDIPDGPRVYFVQKKTQTTQE